MTQAQFQEQSETGVHIGAVCIFSALVMMVEGNWPGAWGATLGYLSALAPWWWLASVSREMSIADARGVFAAAPGEAPVSVREAA